MKYLKRYEQLRESYSICKQYGIKNYTIKNGIVDVEGNVDLSGIGLTELPLKFGRVTGYFDCSRNQLTSLVGAPREVGSFDCSRNQLTTLEGAPEILRSYFNCSGNQLTSLEGAPESVGGNFFCSMNQLTNLIGCPKIVGFIFDCTDNQLTSLVGGPIEVGGSFYCNGNQLTTLEGGPRKVGGDFFCGRNQLTSLVGAPESGGEFYCNDNPVYYIWNLFKDKRFLEKIGGMYSGTLSPFVIKDGLSYVREDILEEIADELGITLPADWRDDVEEGGYSII